MIRKLSLIAYTIPIVAVVVGALAFGERFARGSWPGERWCWLVSPSSAGRDTGQGAEAG